MQATQQTTRSQNTRVDRIKEGAVTVDVYRNDGPKGPFHTMSVYRSYHSKKDDSWMQTSNGFKLKQAKQLLDALGRACRKVEVLDGFEQQEYQGQTEALADASLPASPEAKEPATAAS